MPRLLISATTLAAVLALAAPAPARAQLPGFDARHPSPGTTLPQPAGAHASVSAAAARASKLGITVAADPLRGGTRLVRRADGLLTGPSQQDAQDVALDYLGANLDLFGLSRLDLSTLSLKRRWRSLDGVTHLIWAQRAAGVAAFDNELRAHVTREGRLVSIGGSPRPGLRAEARHAGFNVSRKTARAVARREAGLAQNAPVRRPHKTWFANGDTLIPAWEVRADASIAAAYDLLIDARSGRLLSRHNRVHAAGKALVYENYPGAELGGEQTEQDIGRWLERDDSLYSNAVHVFNDVNGNGHADPRENVGPSGDGDWLYPFQPFTFNADCRELICAWNSEKPRSWRKNMRGEATQAFYYVNKFMDHLAERGFTPETGGYAMETRDGENGGDIIQVLSVKGANVEKGLPGYEDRNNAFMWVDRDGLPATLTLLLHADEGYDTMSGYTAGLVYHEAGHGLVNRLIVDADGWAAVTGQGDAIDEGSSDWFAYSYLNAEGLEPDGPEPGEIKVLAANTKGHTGEGWRTEPLDCPVGAPRAACPGAGKAGRGGYTFGDYGRIYGEPESHADGEIWAQTMWDLRSKFIARYGGEGIARVEALFISAMQLSPAYPNFLDMRNALFDADRVTGAADRDLIWEAFAGRGMGLFASTTARAIAGRSEFEDFTVPASEPFSGTLEGSVRDLVTEKPVRGAYVYVPGIDAFARTDEDGHYELGPLPTGQAIPLVFAEAQGYHFDLAADVTIEAGGTKSHDFELIKNWTSLSAGARVVEPKAKRKRCGPLGAIDENTNPWVTSARRPRSVTIKLGSPVDVLIFGVDPGVHCPSRGVDESSSAGRLRIEVAGKDRRFRQVAKPRFRPADNFVTSPVDPKSFLRRVRYVRLTVLRPQGPHGKEPGYSYSYNMGIGEFEVFGQDGRRAAAVAFR